MPFERDHDQWVFGIAALFAVAIYLLLWLLLRQTRRVRCLAVPLEAVTPDTNTPSRPSLSQINMDARGSAKKDPAMQLVRRRRQIARVVTAMITEMVILLGGIVLYLVRGTRHPLARLAAHSYSHACDCVQLGGSVLILAGAVFVPPGLAAGAFLYSKSMLKCPPAPASYPQAPDPVCVLMHTRSLGGGGLSVHQQPHVPSSAPTARDRQPT